MWKTKQRGTFEVFEPLCGFIVVYTINLPHSKQTIMTI